MTDAELRELKISKPWAENSAIEAGAEASLAWADEQAPPPLGVMPTLSDGERVAFGDLLNTVPDPGAEFSMGAWMQVSALRWGIFVRITGDVFKAAHAYTATWRDTRKPITMPPMDVGDFRDSVLPDSLEYARDIAKYGVRPQGSRRPVRFRQQAYARFEDDPVATVCEMWSDLVMGCIFVFADVSDPLVGRLAESNRTYVAQNDVTNPDVAKPRYISFRSLEINERVASDYHPSCVIPRHRNIARRMLYFKRRCPVIPLSVANRDVKSAFKLTPVSVCGLAHMGYRFANFFGIYLALFLGSRPSPSKWGAISTLAMQHVAAHRPAAPGRDGPEWLVAFQYVGDGAFIEPRVGIRPWLAPTLWETALPCELWLGAFRYKSGELRECRDPGRALGY